VTLEQLISARDELMLQRSTGVRSIQFQDRQTVFNSDREIQAALSDLNRRIAEMQSSRVAPTTIRFATSKGL
jgi:hypothetical protein